jgi:type I restriction enzyme, R subunit
MSVTGSEYTLAEKPCLDALRALGYTVLSPEGNLAEREALNAVLLPQRLMAAVQRLNGVDAEVARLVYTDLAGETDNQRWLALQRGTYSRNVPGSRTRKTIRLIDFTDPVEGNDWVVTSQFYVQAQSSRKPDLVVFCNGIPLVVIECKSPVAGHDKTGEAFEQIKQYERDIPRLFAPNLFSIVTDGVTTCYGATGAPSQHWGIWQDPAPRRSADFATPLDQHLFSMLDPRRLLDLLAHFTVFETRDQRTVKKLCRYQQYRAVNRIIERVCDAKYRRGLVWHTQGSGKSLTMAYAVLKLKWHLGIDHAELCSPNILLLTDRVDLDEQICRTFEACGLPNPMQADSGKNLQGLLHGGSRGMTVLSTIQKLEGSRTPVADSAAWIVLVDECHRTQERDLGAFLRATLPDARFFGFTGTPIKTTDKDTYANFGVPGEGYLDRYGIDDAVRDGATVPIRYTGRKAEWQVDPAKLDIQFDQWFADQPPATVDAIKKRGVTIAELAKHPRRVELIALDAWTHFQAHCQPDGLKAQLVAIDREAVILYKRALDRVIAETLVAQGVAPEDAKIQAEARSACVYSSSQEDAKPSEDPWVGNLRADLVRLAQDREGEKRVVARFLDRTDPLGILIVCNKLLTGFDAPDEAVMYLDSPLKEHSLLQAIARTNRVSGPHKDYGLIVDYIGVTKHLDEALSSYRADDVRNALHDLDTERSRLRDAHRALLPALAGIPRSTGARTQVKKEFDTLVQRLGTEDAWLGFKRLAKAFLRAYEAVCPDPAVLEYQVDCKWVAGFVAYATLIFERKDGIDLRGMSGKIREMLAQHLAVTGIATICQLRNLTDPHFTDDFSTEGKDEADLKTAAIRKASELKRVLREKAQANEAQFGRFSERVLEVLQRMEAGQIGAADALKAYEDITREILATEQAHRTSGLTREAFAIRAILEACQKPTVRAAEGSDSYEKSENTDALGELATAIDAIYRSDQAAPAGWHLKDSLRRELRQTVRALVFAQRQLLGDAWKDVPAQVDEYAALHYLKV